MGSPKEVDVATSTAPTDTEEAQLRDSDRQADTQPEERAGNTSKCAQETRKQVQQEQDKAEATEKSTEHRGSAQEQEQVQKEQQISEPEEEMSVISSDASPHDSDFDFLQINTADGHGYCLLSIEILQVAIGITPFYAETQL
ncbi:hypothetical protein PHYBOEH_010400 [Phytophthora boehmeriae]|uniref:Uncharacterized protein n=1 Tax=Phytophthora boehmeriae TaxID=109152 RepID=A0A8T1VMU2_9STRA|nr:hypothetical protein PHYBOEH_010400 [Phytophthora boehmeriae]